VRRRPAAPQVGRAAGELAGVAERLRRASPAALGADATERPCTPLHPVEILERQAEACPPVLWADADVHGAAAQGGEESVVGARRRGRAAERLRGHGTRGQGAERQDHRQPKGRGHQHRR
jgi:hypothetical protein